MVTVHLSACAGEPGWWARQRRHESARSPDPSAAAAATTPATAATTSTPATAATAATATTASTASFPAASHQ